MLCLTAAAWQNPNTSRLPDHVLFFYAPSGLLLFLNDMEYLYNTAIKTSFPYAMSDPLSVEFSGILKWIAIPLSRGSSQPRDQTQVSCIGGRFFTVRATREAHTYIETVNRARIISLVVSGNLWNHLMVLTIKLNF